MGDEIETGQVDAAETKAEGVDVRALMAFAAPILRDRLEEVMRSFQPEIEAGLYYVELLKARAEGRETTDG